MPRFQSAFPVTKSKYKAMKLVSPAGWRLGIQEACKTAFSRLMHISDSDIHDTILTRIDNGAKVDEPAWAPKCFLVERANPESTSPFQLQVMGTRILAQKTIYAAYRDVPPSDMGTWQVQQRCVHSNGSWWCFEPSHLEKSSRQNVPNADDKLSIPGSADAIYVPRIRVPRPKKGSLARPAKNEFVEQQSALPIAEAQLRSLQPHRRTSPVQHRPVSRVDGPPLMPHTAGVGAISALDPFVQSILANVESQQQQDAFADFKGSWNFPAVSRAEVFSVPQSHHGVSNLSGSENAF